MTIKVGIHTFPCEGGMAQMMVCRGITIRLKKEHPGADVFVDQVDDAMGNAEALPHMHDNLGLNIALE
jgi:hypothetical protein